MGKARTSRIQATWKRRPKIKRLMLPQEVMKYWPLLFLTKKQSMVNVIVQFCQFPRPYTTIVKPLKKLLSARWCNLPLCFDCAMIIEWRLSRQVNRSSLTNHCATSFAWSPPNGLFLWSHVKTVVYLSKPLSLDELKVGITNTVHAIIEQELKNIFKFESRF